MPLWKNKALNLTETEIRQAIANTKSNNEAARFLGCGIDTYRRYAKLYLDPTTDQTLWDLHRNFGGAGIKRVHGVNTKFNFKKIPMSEILEGKHPSYDRKILAERLLNEGIFDEKCCNCGFDERRVTDFKVPLMLNFKDGDYTNHKRDNLEFLCYNDFFLMVDDVFINVRRAHVKGY